MTGLLTGVDVIQKKKHTQKTVLNIQESYHILRYGPIGEDAPLWGKISIRISHLLITLSSAFNIVIYYYKDFKFRAALKSICGSLRRERLSTEETIFEGCSLPTLTTRISING